MQTRLDACRRQRICVGSPGMKIYIPLTRQIHITDLQNCRSLMLLIQIKESYLFSLKINIIENDLDLLGIYKWSSNSLMHISVLIDTCRSVGMDAPERRRKRLRCQHCALHKSNSKLRKSSVLLLFGSVKSGTRVLILKGSKGTLQKWS